MSLADPVHDAQAIFRAVLTAIAHPGRIMALTATVMPPAPLAPSAAALCLTLADLDSPVWLDPPLATREVRDFLHFHTGAPIVARAEDASFAVIGNAASLAALDGFDPGTDEQPDRSTTLIVQVPSLRTGPVRQISGPGIETAATIAIDGLSSAFWPALRRNHALFPRGLDLLLVAGRDMLALPRTTRLDA